MAATNEDANFPASNLLDGKPWRPFRFGAVATDPTVEFDIQMIDGEFESTTPGQPPPSPWKTSGTVAVSSAQAKSGSNSLSLSSNSAAAYHDVSVVPGNLYRFNAQLYGDGTSAITAYLLDLMTGKWWDPAGSGSWVTSKTAFRTQTSAAWTTGGGDNVLVEGAPLGWVAPYRLRILIERPASVAGAAYADDIYFWPGIDTAALMFDTIPNAYTLRIRNGQTSGSYTLTLGTFGAGRFRRYIAGSALTGSSSSLNNRYWAVVVTGDLIAGSMPWIGQVMLGQRRVFQTKPSWGIVQAREMPKGGPEESPVSLAQAARYRFDMEWESPASHYNQIADELLGGSVYGDEPVLIVADSDDTEFVYGRGAAMAAVSPSRNPIDRSIYQLSVLDDRYPLITG